MNGTWNLKLFLSISLGLHLFVLSLLSILMPDLKIIQLPRLDIEVSFLPFAKEERELPRKVEKRVTVRSSPAPIKSGEFRVRSEEVELKTEPLESVKIHDEKKVVQTERVEVTLPKKQEESVATPPVQSQPKVISVSDLKPSPLQSENKEIEIKQEERIVVASLGNPVPSISSSEKPHTALRSPPLSESDIIFAQPRYAENPKPLYPREAKKKGYEGEVLLRVEVLSNGQVGEIEVRRSSGHEVLDRSAIKTVKQWKFIPAKKGETPVPIWVNIPVAFQLR
ncbi:MAG: energy transducer TonB [Deltaproteobacteria bacterium]|nr:energy transducer TonB [Deltaproteobacteria bacterium]